MPDDILDVAIIGAGIAGLAAGAVLQQAGYRVCLYEKAGQVGGRIATHWHGSQAFDYGAQNIKATGTPLESRMRHDLPHGDLLTIPGPVCLHHAGRVLPGDEAANRASKYAYRHGLAMLPQLLQAGLNVRLNTAVQKLQQSAAGYELRDAEGKRLGLARSVVLSLPAPLAADLLAASQLSSDENERIAALRSVQYTRCLTVLLQYDFWQELPFYALLAQDRAHPLLWLAVENAKGQESQTNLSLVAQLGPEISRHLWERAESAIVPQTTQWLAELLGERFLQPAWTHLRRWEHSQPVNPVEFEAVNPPGARLVLCGDGTARGRIPESYESGLQAAQRIMAALQS